MKAVAKARAKSRKHKTSNVISGRFSGGKHPNVQTVPPTREAAPLRTMCQEASGVSTPYVEGMTCLRPAVWLVQHKGQDPMAMCEGCADHNVKNRSAIYWPKGQPYVLYSPPHVEAALGRVGGEADTLSTGEEASLKPPAHPTKLKQGDELRKYVDDGMVKFHGYVEQEITRMLGEDRPASELAQVYMNLRAIQDRVEITMKMIDKVEETMAEITIPETFKREKLKSFTTSNGFRVGTSMRLMASIVKGMKEAAFKWLRANGLPDLIQEQVHAGTLSSTAKDLLEHGRELPEEFFATYYKPGTSLTKVQVKK